MQNFAKSFVTKRDSLRMCSFVPAGSDEPLFPSDIFSSGSAEPAGHEPRNSHKSSFRRRFKLRCTSTLPVSHGHCFVILNARPFVPTLPILSPSNVPCTHSHWFVLFFIFLSLNNDRVNCLSVISGGSSFRFNTTPATT